MITAEEFLESKGLFNDKSLRLENWKMTTSEAMIEFAKLHVQEALKQASEKVEIHSSTSSYHYYEFEEGIRNRNIWVPVNSILNAYNLENIK